MYRYSEEGEQSRVEFPITRKPRRSLIDYPMDAGETPVRTTSGIYTAGRHGP
ncbi:hypothetical protein L226DRAFT_541148 [Lentinus tigrinus ALCF2SS1-7]|uniref:uncharacterized protein n=1 Tax=Lentinus tigrinus ALCF2SS1-7 TaxID=1328758 RepID=UPI001165EDAB|nr:hypothetical protein L226DRAFT_541177 [Lentinus tigrinus ALCF2SS1-7]RPD67840.1 hypothetical protein L226DRAFT_541148 [Lentinus tigrinus ALCF2SS1-7]